MDFTLLQFLSGTLAERLNLSPTELLSAINAISAIPAHPYDQAKYELFGPDHKFTTFQEIETPKEFNLTTAQHELTSYSQQRFETVQSMLSVFQTEQIKNTDAYKEYEIFDRETAKKSIIFSEAMRTLTLKEINADPKNVAKKVLSFYLKVHL